MKDTKVKQAKLQYWAGLIHECQNSGMKKKDWLESKGILKDTYYYWYKKVQEACVEAMDLPDTLPAPTFVELPAPTVVTAPAASAVITSGNIRIEISEDVSESFLIKLLGAMNHAQ